MFLAFVVSAVKHVSLSMISNDAEPEQIRSKYANNGISLLNDIKTLYKHLLEKDDLYPLRLIQHNIPSLFENVTDMPGVYQKIKHECLGKKLTDQEINQIQDKAINEYKQSQELLRVEKQDRIAECKEKYYKVQHINNQRNDLINKAKGYVIIIKNNIETYNKTGEIINIFKKYIKTDNYKNTIANAVLNTSINQFNEEICNNIDKLLTEANQYDINTLKDIVKQLVNFREDINGSVRIFVRLTPPRSDYKGCKIYSEIYDYNPFVPNCNYVQKIENSSKHKNEANWYLTFGTPTEENTFGPFYSIFNDEQNNKMIYDHISEMIGQIIDGYNIALFGYGYSGSGKTYTLMNTPDDNDVSKQGILIHAINDIMRLGNSVEIDKIYELYINNILTPNLTQRKLDGKEIDLTKHDSLLKHITEFNKDYQVSSKLSKLNVLLTNIKQIRFGERRIKKTINNDESSRSHLFIKFLINKQTNLTVCDMGGREDPGEIYQNSFININTGELSTEYIKGVTYKIEDFTTMREFSVYIHYPFKKFNFNEISDKVVLNEDFFKNNCQTKIKK